MRATQAQISRTIRAAAQQGISVCSAEHFPDGRVVLHFTGTTNTTATNPEDDWK